MPEPLHRGAESIGIAMKMPRPAREPSTSQSPASSFVVVEDDRLLRDLLVRSLRQRFAPVAVADFGEGRPATRHCLEHPPSVLITDLRLPDMDGREIIRALRRRSASTRIVVLTENATPALPGELIALGVGGFVDKASTFEHTENAVARVLAGGMYFSAEVSPTPTPFAAAPESSHRANPPPEILKPREREIARLVAGGLSSKEIAAQLELSVRTVEKERARLMTKLGLRDLPALVRWCLTHGLI